MSVSSVPTVPARRPCSTSSHGSRKHDSGHLYYRDRLIDGFKPHQMVNLGLARTFQNINLFDEQSTLDNILVGAHQRIGNPFACMFSLPAGPAPGAGTAGSCS